jgi:predicted AAA+ superfamily ATPase
MLQHNRAIKERLRRRAAGRHGRLLVLTGARQTGKTTLARESFPDLRYLSLEDPVVRPDLTALSATQWIERYPRAVLDEVQKAPSLVETVKAAYDADAKVRYVLLGSSQILLLSKVRESLAGRVAIEELWPLTLPEMMTSSWEEPVLESRLLQWLRQPTRRALKQLDGMPASSPSYARASAQLERYLTVGGMPAIVDPELTEDECERWLNDYQRTYLERDVADLAAMRDLEPFVLAQRAIAQRSGKLVNFSDLARLTDISPPTAKRFVRYLELSYQVIQLQPYFRNAEKRLSKAPKVHFVDPGILRSILRRRGSPSGEEFESAVVAEIYKQCRNADLRAVFNHVRTHDGREVDLLIELDEGFVAFEVKQARRVSDSDGRHLRGLGDLLDKPLLAAFLLSLDIHPRKLTDGILALPVAWALGPPDP